jgi:hypothetical protein
VRERSDGDRDKGSHDEDEEDRHVGVGHGWCVREGGGERETPGALARFLQGRGFKKAVKSRSEVERTSFAGTMLFPDGVTVNWTPSHTATLGLAN